MWNRKSTAQSYLLLLKCYCVSSKKTPFPRRRLCGHPVNGHKKLWSTRWGPVLGAFSPKNRQLPHQAGPPFPRFCNSQLEFDKCGFRWNRTSLGRSSWTSVQSLSRMLTTEKSFIWHYLKYEQVWVTKERHFFCLCNKLLGSSSTFYASITLNLRAVFANRAVTPIQKALSEGFLPLSLHYEHVLKRWASGSQWTFMEQNHRQ